MESVEHLKLIQEPSYLKVQARHIITGEPGLTLLAILHEDDHSCCNKESWEQTERRMIEAAQEVWDRP